MAVRRRRPPGVAAPKTAPRREPAPGVAAATEDKPAETIPLTEASNRKLRIGPPKETIVFRVGPIPHYDRGTNYGPGDLVHKTVVDGVLRRCPKTWSIHSIDGRKLANEMPVHLTFMDAAWCEVYNSPRKPSRKHSPVDRGFYEDE